MWNQDDVKNYSPNIKPKFQRNVYKFENFSKNKRNELFLYEVKLVLVVNESKKMNGTNDLCLHF